MHSLRMEMDVLNGQSSSGSNPSQSALIERESEVGSCWNIRMSVPGCGLMWRIEMCELACACVSGLAGQDISFFHSLTLMCLLVAVNVAVDVLNFSRCLNLGVFAFTAAGCTAYSG